MRVSAASRTDPGHRHQSIVADARAAQQAQPPAQAVQKSGTCLDAEDGNGGTIFMSCGFTACQQALICDERAPASLR